MTDSLISASAPNRYIAVVPAAGVGSRVGADRPKQYLSICGATIFEHTLTLLLNVSAISEIVVAVAADDVYWQSLPVMQDGRVSTVIGGASRSDSVLAALRSLPDEQGLQVLVHDVARPCVTVSEIESLIAGVDDDCGGLLALPATDTLKRSSPRLQQVLETVDRSEIWQAQTPQLFSRSLLLRALSSAQLSGQVVTDESSAIELLGLQPKLIEGRSSNIKVTRPEDVALAGYYLQQTN